MSSKFSQKNQAVEVLTGQTHLNYKSLISLGSSILKTGKHN